MKVILRREAPKNLFLTIAAFLSLSAFAEPKIEWNFYSRFEFGTKSFNENLEHALSHPNALERKIEKIIIFKNQECLSQREQGQICIPFDRLLTYESLVDRLIHESQPKLTHPKILPLVRIFPQNGQGGGAAGFFWNSDGDIVTNAHVVKDQAQVFVVPIERDLVLANHGFLADVIAKDDFSDLALVRIKKDTPFYQAFITTYGTFPYVLKDQRAWHGADLMYLKDSTFKIYGFPQYAMTMPTSVPGRLIKDSMKLFGTRVILIDYKVDHGFSGGPVFTEEGFIAGITDSMFVGPEVGLVGGLAIDYISAELILNQLKDSQKVFQELIILRDGFGHLQVHRVARNFDYHVNWDTDQESLVYDGLTFMNAYTQQKKNKVPIGVLLEENQSQNPIYAAYNAKTTIVRKLNGRSLNGSVLDSPLRQLSWMLRSVPANEPLRFDVVQLIEIPEQK